MLRPFDGLGQAPSTGSGRASLSTGDGPSLGQYESFGEFQLLLRAGDVLIPKLDCVEPLKVECQHFVECVHTRQKPLTDGRAGMIVVQALEAAQRSLDNDGLLQEVAAEGLL